MELNLKPKNPELYLPKPVRINKVVAFTEHEKFFNLELLDGKPLGHVPGQFVQLSLLGIGEAPISISSPPSDKSNFDICVRAVGNVTNKLHSLKKGDIVHIRGPFGHGFTKDICDTFEGKHLLMISGGIGYIPLRSLINQVIPNKKQYKKISILSGCRTPNDRMYKDELDKIAEMGGNVELLETVNEADTKWKGFTGVITILIPKVKFKPKETIAIIVGPPIMYKFVLKSLKDLDVPNENIYMSLERRMECGVGKCGHCQMEGVYVCQEGPVFNYADVLTNNEVF